MTSMSMNKERIAALVVLLALVGSTAWILTAFKARQKQGKPGLKLAEQPTLDTRGGVVAPVSVALPETVLDYVSTNLPVDDLELSYLPKDTTYGRRNYSQPGSEPEYGYPFRSTMTVVLMGTDRTSIHKPEFCLTGQGWKIEKSELQTISIERPHRYELPTRKLTAGMRWKGSDGRIANLRAVYVYWFVSANRLTAEHKERMWATVEDLVQTGTLPRWAYVSCLTVCMPGQEEAAYQRMERLIAAAVPEFQLTTLPGPAEQRAAVAAFR
jgi:hypothetical protein